MILSDTDVEERLISKNNLVNIITIKKGKTAGAGNVPPMVRELLGVMALTSDETKTDIAKAFDVDVCSVSNYSRGLLGSCFDEELAEGVQEKAHKTLEQKSASAHESAVDCLMDSLGSLAPLLKEGSGLKPKELSRIAGDMSRIVANLKPKEDNTVINNTQVILYKPPQREEKAYETIDA